AAVLAGGPAGSFARALPGQAADDEVTLHLPSTASGPAASPELLVQPTAGGAAAGRLSLAAWRVPVLYFEPAAALSLLAALARLAPGDVVASPSIGYLGAAARFADDLAARGRVLPALAAEDGGYRARWRPVLSAADARHARELAAAMPPACRALAGSEQAGHGPAGHGPAGHGPDGPGLAGAGVAPGPLFADMLDVLADASVRARLPGPLLPARKGRRPARVDVAERMVLALAGPQPAVEIMDAADEGAAQDLAAALADWLSSAAGPAGSVRTCFRLVEPPTADETGVGPGNTGVAPTASEAVAVPETTGPAPAAVAPARSEEH